MRQYSINNEFIYNESLREIISLHDKKSAKDDVNACALLKLSY